MEKSVDWVRASSSTPDHHKSPARTATTAADRENRKRKCSQHSQAMHYFPVEELHLKTVMMWYLLRNRNISQSTTASLAYP
jgi:hypothetical protein